MESATVHRHARDGQSTLIARLARFIRERPGRWIDGRELALVGGAYAWRTRISELRRSPFNMTIKNRQRTMRGSAGVITVSEYRYLPDAPTATTNDRPLLPGGRAA